MRRHGNDYHMVWSGDDRSGQRLHTEDFPAASPDRTNGSKPVFFCGDHVQEDSSRAQQNDTSRVLAR